MAACLPACLPACLLGVCCFAAQGDGTAQLLCRDAAAQQEVCRILTSDFGMHCMLFTVPPTGGNGTPAAGQLPAAAAAGTASLAPHANGSSGKVQPLLQRQVAGTDGALRAVAAAAAHPPH